MRNAGQFFWGSLLGVLIVDVGSLINPMNIFIYCPTKSKDALVLTDALKAHRLRRFDGMDFWNKSGRMVLVEGDIVICWGTTLPDLGGVRILNSAPGPRNFYERWKKLRQSGVPTVSCHDVDDVPNLSSFLSQGWFLKKNRSGKPICLIGKETFQNEFRIHSFSGRSIRAGEKKVIDGFTLSSEADWKPGLGLAHPWKKTPKYGWETVYTGFVSTALMRNLAHKAIKALGLTFGVVDMGLGMDGKLKVIDVKLAPDIEGDTLKSYLRAIARWIEKDETGDPIEEAPVPVNLKNEAAPFNFKVVLDAGGIFWNNNNIIRVWNDNE